MPDSIQQEARQILDSIATKHLTAASIEQITHDLPDYVKAALLEKSTEMECSLEAVVEMAFT
jgi:hypothetical protein